jgi:nucleotide-binding universal stress UspA family protein
MPQASQDQRRRRRPAADERSATATSAQAPFANVLCAVDGTRGSTAAVRMAVAVVAPGGLLTLLVVTAQAGSGAYASAAISPGRARQVLRQAARIADEAGVACRSVIEREGPPADAILARARAHDLLVIGMPAISWLAGLVVGGVGETALGRFTTPLLIAHRAFTGSLQGRRVLVASDGEPASDRAVELAGRLARGKGARATLVHALTSESTARPRRVEAQAQALGQMLPGGADSLIEPGRATEVLTAAARSARAVILVMGNRRLRGLRALGSVSRRVLRHAPCSLLVLPPG